MTAEAYCAGPASFIGAGPSGRAAFSARALSTTDIVLTVCVGNVSITRRESQNRFIGVTTSALDGDPLSSRIVLVGHDGSQIELMQAGDADIVAEWRAAARAFGQPMIVQQTGDRYLALETMLGEVLVGAAHAGRTLRALTRRRRPRFLTRRKTARLPLAPVVHASSVR